MTFDTQDPENTPDRHQENALASLMSYLSGKRHEVRKVLQNAIFFIPTIRSVHFIAVLSYDP